MLLPISNCYSTVFEPYIDGRCDVYVQKNWTILQSFHVEMIVYITMTYGGFFYLHSVMSFFLFVYHVLNICLSLDENH